MPPITAGRMTTGGAVCNAFACGAARVLSGSAFARPTEAPRRGYPTAMATRDANRPPGRAVGAGLGTRGGGPGGGTGAAGPSVDRAIPAPGVRLLGTGDGRQRLAGALSGGVEPGSSKAYGPPGRHGGGGRLFPGLAARQFTVGM